jgi:3-isopropylmalate dehydrogenase
MVRGGIYEPSHGSAPDISGRGIANPMATILSVAMMFEYAFARVEIARQIEDAVEQTLQRGILTPDLGGTATTNEVTAAVLSALRAN